MKLNRFIAKSRIIDIKSKDFVGAVRELIDTCPLPAENIEKKRLSLHSELIDREHQMTTCLGNGISLPHIRVAMNRPYIFAIGRCATGLEFEDLEEYRSLRMVCLMLANEEENSYLQVLASLARIFQERVFVDRLSSKMPLKDFREGILLSFGGTAQATESKTTRFNRLILRESEKIARGAKCSSVLVFGESFVSGVNFNHSFPSMKTVLVTNTATEVSEKQFSVDVVLPVPSYSSSRLSQLRSAVLIGLTRGVFKYNDRLCCLGGAPGGDQFDTIVVVDVEKEFQSVFTKQAELLPPTVKPEVMERVLAIAMELAVEGREGSPVGCLFVIGDADKIRPFAKPLILNPFYGYKGEDRNILNPFMDETLKELSTIDGAFVIRGDGVMESAGSLIHVSDFNHKLPGGLGSRHAAGAAISMATDCIAICVSSSGQITLFRRGEMLPLMGKQGGLGM